MVLPASSDDVVDVAEHYDQLNVLYLALWGEHRHHGLWKSGAESCDEAVNHMADEIVRAAGIHQGECVVDVGCGTGATLRDFIDQHEAQVWGCTVSEEEKKTAEKLTSKAGRGQASFFCCDWLENDLPDEWADTVVMIESFCHMDEPHAVIYEVARVLKPGGRLILADWGKSSGSPSWGVKWLLNAICKTGCLADLRPLEKNRALLKELSFEVKECRDLTQQVKRTWSVMSWRIVKKVVTDASCRKMLWRSFLSKRDRFLAIPLVMLAYQLGCLRYGWLVAEKGSCVQGGIEAQVRNE